MDCKCSSKICNIEDSVHLHGPMPDHVLVISKAQLTSNRWLEYSSQQSFNVALLFHSYSNQNVISRHAKSGKIIVFLTPNIRKYKCYFKKNHIYSLFSPFIFHLLEFPRKYYRMYEYGDNIQAHFNSRPQLSIIPSSDNGLGQIRHMSLKKNFRIFLKMNGVYKVPWVDE